MRDEMRRQQSFGRRLFVGQDALDDADNALAPLPAQNAILGDPHRGFARVPDPNPATEQVSVALVDRDRKAP